MANRRAELKTRYREWLLDEPPRFLDEQSWRIFLAHVREERTLREISQETGLSEVRVGTVVAKVARKLERPRSSTGPAYLPGHNSPVEDLRLSERSCNTLLRLGCQTIGDVLGKDFSGTVPGMGPFTRSEIGSALAAAGFQPPPTLDGRRTDTAELRRDVDRLRTHVDAAFRALYGRLERLEDRLRSLLGRETANRTDGSGQ